MSKEINKEDLKKDFQNVLEQIRGSGERTRSTLKKISSNWGGSRENAGRPSLFEEKVTENVGFKIPLSYAQKVDELRKEGESRGQTARRLLVELLDSKTSSNTD